MEEEKFSASLGDIEKQEDKLNLRTCVYATLLTNDCDLEGVKVLNYSIHKHSKMPLVIFTTNESKNIEFSLNE